MKDSHVNRQHIVEMAIELFRKKGYSATSINDIIKACGITKGALYHYFSSKEKLAIEAIQQVKNIFESEIFILSNASGMPAKERFNLFNEKVEKFFIQNKDGCLLANLTLELGASFELFRVEILDFFTKWERSYYKLFLNFFDNDKARLMASDTLASIQGCILMYRASGNLEILKRRHQIIIDICDGN